MKAVKILVIALIGMFVYDSASAQIFHHRRHHRVVHHYHHRMHHRY